MFKIYTLKDFESKVFFHPREKREHEKWHGKKVKAELTLSPTAIYPQCTGNEFRVTTEYNKTWDYPGNKWSGREN